MHAKVLAPIETASALVNTEREQVAAEREAFQTFQDSVAECEPRRQQLFTQPERVRFSPSTEDTTDPHQQLQQAYRETVMSVEHYEQVYNESLQRSLHNELGADIASGLCDGTPFTPQFKRGLQTAVAKARESRTSFVEDLETEAKSLSDAHASLSEIVRAMQPEKQERRIASDHRSDSIAALEARCMETVEARQQVVVDQLSAMRLNHNLYCYLYATENWTYPVLTTASTLVCDLRALEPCSGTPASPA